MDDGLSFGHWLKVQRVALRLTQADLAKRIGYSTVTVRKLESDDLRPSRQIAEQLAAHLELAPENRLDFIRFAQGAAAAKKMSPFVSHSGRQQSSKIAHHSSTQLPIPLTPLVGREADVMNVERLVLHTNVRLVSLTGAGGIGKTRLGLEVAHAVLEHFPDGLYFVDLTPITDSSLVAATIASTIGLHETGGQSLLEALKYFLREKHLLLFLDNFEQVISAASIVADLLVACARFKVLVTSREPLHVRGEKQYPVGPLMLPERLKDERQPAEGASRVEVTHYAAVELFVQRASDVTPNFIVTDENARVIAEICVRLGGLPLAIELAAARMNVLSPEAILARLAGTSGHTASSLRLLTSGARDLPARQRTLRNTIAWSYDLLNGDEQQLFRRLSVFVGGCILGTAEAVCNVAGDLNIDMLDGVGSLVDKNLLRQVQGKADEPRFTLLETIREYALERLAASGEAEALRRQHAEYYLVLAEAAEPQLYGPEQQLWLNRLEQEHDNIRAAIGWSATTDDTEIGLRIAGAVSLFWEIHSYFNEGRTWLRTLLSRSAAMEPTAARAKALNAAGDLALNVYDIASARLLFEESLAIRQALGDTNSRAYALKGLGEVARLQGNSTQAEALFHKSLPLFRELGEAVSMAWVLIGLGNLALYRGDIVAARAYHEESLAIHRATGDKRSMSAALNRLGEVARSQGDHQQAAMYYDESLNIAQELSHKSGIAIVLQNLAHVAQYQGDTAQAVARFRAGLALAQELGLKELIAACFAGLAGVAAAAGQSERAVQLFGASEALLDGIGATLEPADQADYDRSVAMTHTQFDESAFAAAWEAGRALTLDQAIAYAFGEDA